MLFVDLTYQTALRRERPLFRRHRGAASFSTCVFRW